MMRSGTMTATNIGVLYVMMMIVDTTGETVAIQFCRREIILNIEDRKFVCASIFLSVTL